MNSSQFILFTLLSIGLLLEWYARNPSVILKGANFIFSILVDLESQHLVLELEQEPELSFEDVVEKSFFLSPTHCI